MELRQLHYLVACAKAKSFSKASISLYTSQSNVSKTIQSLEKELGYDLFIRRQKGIELTPKGKQVYNYALSMLEFGTRIQNLSMEVTQDELSISFQPSSWFASAFCEYYLRQGSNKKRYNVISVPLEEIIQRLSEELDQLGFTYIAAEQLENLQELFSRHHLTYIVLNTTETALYNSNDHQKQSDEDLFLIQGVNDRFCGITAWNRKSVSAEQKQRQHTVITTNSDYIIQEILTKTDLCNISPKRISHDDSAPFRNIVNLENPQKLMYICVFRNDRSLTGEAKQFVAFIRDYAEN